MPKIVIGVMGPGKTATATNLQNAFELGKLIALEGWVLLTGGVNLGVMDAASQGAKSVGGLTLGILPTGDRSIASAALDIVICTDMGSARNNINILSSDIVISCGVSAGTLSEMALALRAQKKLILLDMDIRYYELCINLAPENVFMAQHPQETMAIAKQLLFSSNPAE